MRGSTSTKKTNVCPMTGKSGTCPMQSSSGTTNKEGRIVSPKEQQDEIWNTVVQLNSKEEEEEERKWPSYDAVMSDVAFSDYSQVLECPLDVRPSSSSNGKKLCPYGTAACVEMTIFENTPYTGLLRPGQTLSHGIIRLSSAIQPLVPSSKGKKTSIWNKPLLLAAGKELSGAKLFPTVAIKFFRHNGIRSGNLLFAGRKVGQSEHDFFAHCVCTQLTEKVATPLKPIVKIFAAYSKNPLSLGVSDFCSYNVHGEQETNIQFPFAIALKPLLTFPHHNDDNDVPFDSFLNDLVTIPKGTAIYDVFACPNPLAVEDASQLQRIGQIKTTSSMIPSGPTDSLFFRHQNKEEDFQYQPQWKREIKQHNINNKAGWKIFERHIATGTYQDFEKK